MGDNRRRNHHKKAARRDDYKPPFPAEVLAEPVTNLSIRDDTSNLLTGAGIMTIGDVVKRMEADFYKICRFNKKNLLDVKFALKKRNLFLRPTPLPEQAPSPSGEQPAAAEQKMQPGKQQNKQDRSARPDQQGKPHGDREKKGNRTPETPYVMTTLIERPPKPVKEPVKEEPDRYVKVNKGGLWGFKERTGKDFIVPPVYDEVFTFKEDLCCVQKDEKFGFINRQGEEVIPLVYDCATSFSEGLACVFKGEVCGYINAKNETVIEFKFDAGTPVINGECRVKKAGKWGELHIENPSEIRWIV